MPCPSTHSTTSCLLSTPRPTKEGAGARQREWIRSAVTMYLDLAERHRAGLRRLG
jgi:hypothetical protein